MLVLAPSLELLSSARGISSEVLWRSESKLIGKTHWIGIIYYCSIYETTFSGFHYYNKNYDPCRPITQWNPEKKHPSYNSNDGTYYGLPKSLKKIWEENKEMQLCVSLSIEDSLSKLSSLSKCTLFD